MKRLLLLFIFVFTLCASACTPRETTLTVMTHDSFAISTDVVAAFEQVNNARVVFVKSGDAGEALMTCRMPQGE